MATRSSDVPLVPLSGPSFNKLRQREDVSKVAGGTPELGDKNGTLPKVSTALTGLCERFDLSDPIDRSRYGELSAKLFTGQEFVRLWEEKTTGPSGEIFVYVNYVQYMTVYTNGNDNFKLAEDR